MMPDTEVGAESIYNLFNEKELLYFQEHYLTMQLLHLTVNIMKLRQWVKNK